MKDRDRSELWLIALMALLTAVASGFTIWGWLERLG